MTGARPVSDRILDAAGRLFAERGLAAVGMGDIAAAAGCGRATVYRCFEDRHALRVAFVHREARRLAGEVQAEVDRREGPGAPSAARLGRGIAVAVRMVRADPVLAAWFTEEAAGATGVLARSSQVIEGLVAGFLGEPSTAEARARGRWIVRSILSLLAVPGEDEDDEQTTIGRFVVPAALGPAPIAQPSDRSRSMRSSVGPR